MLNVSFCLCEFCFCIPPLVSFDLRPSLGSSRNAPPPPSLGRGITQHSSPRRRGERALRDDPQNGCKEDYTTLLCISFLKVNVIFLREGRRGGGETTGICTQSTCRSSKPSHSKPWDRHELVLNFQLVINLSIHIIIKANLIRSLVRINFLDKIFFYRALWSSCSKKWWHIINSEPQAMSYIMLQYLMKKNAIQFINYLFIQWSVILARLFVLFCNSKALIGLAIMVYEQLYHTFVRVCLKSKTCRKSIVFTNNLERIIDTFEHF